jgi:hypothetical protein
MHRGSILRDCRTAQECRIQQETLHQPHIIFS